MDLAKLCEVKDGNQIVDRSFIRPEERQVIRIGSTLDDERPAIRGDGYPDFECLRKKLAEIRNWRRSYF